MQEAVEALARDYPIILVTKGDLLHQETKLARSGLGHLFKGIEIVSEKDPRRLPPDHESLRRPAGTVRDGRQLTAV